MSKENVQKFYELLQQDASVVEELKKASEGVDSAEKAVEVVLAFAKEKGFEFTKEDLAAFEEECQKELSVEELEKINAAGRAGGFCIVIGVGWGGQAEGGGGTVCYVLGLGLGATWREYESSNKAGNVKIVK